VVVDVVVGVVVVVVVVGEVVPVELQAAERAPSAIAPTVPATAAHRREVFFTNDIHTHYSCENAGVAVNPDWELRWGLRSTARRCRRRRPRPDR
jgi:hypothetical protein